jgi:beta-lactam-binding protein with PASTA domain
MPDLIGRTRREAEDEMVRLGLSYVVIEVATPVAPAGTVYNQSPEAGRAVKRGDSVTLLVARSP